MLKPNRARPAFTMVELLVVIAIIAVLTALAVRGVFQVIESQRVSNTETALHTIHQTFQKHWSHVLSEAQKETGIPADVVSLADGHMDRAKVIWVKFRLVEAFPVSFAEIQNQPLYVTQAGYTGPFIPSDRRKYNPGYNQMLLARYPPPPNTPLPGPAPPAPPGGKGPVTPPTPPPPGSPPPISAPAPGPAPPPSFPVWPPPWPVPTPPPGVPIIGPPISSNPLEPGQFDPATESGACLLMALSVTRSGAALQEDFLRSYTFDTDSDGMKELTDAWKKPLTFFRYPTNNQELHNSNPAKAGSTEATKFRDPLDPKGYLTDKNWDPAKRATYESMAGYLVINPSDGYAYYTVPVIASRSRNLLLGLASDMSVIDANAAGDNLYSFTRSK